MRKLITTIVTIIAAAAALSGCGPSSGSSAPAPDMVVSCQTENSTPAHF